MEKQANGQENNNKFLNMDDIKKILDIPDFRGAHVHEYPTKNIKITCPPKIRMETNENKFDKIPEYLKSSRPVYTTNKNFASGDSAEFPFPKNSNSNSNFRQEMSSYNSFFSRFETPASFMSMDHPADVLSGYDEYMKYHNDSEGLGQWRVTPQATLSLTIDHDMQVDVTVDGAIRIINPKAHIAMSVNPLGTHTAIMHPMGRILQEGPTAMLMAYDMMQSCHKFAKMWPQRTVFKTSLMNFAYTMDLSGTRTTLCAFPKIPNNDISLPVFYSCSSHGSLYKGQAQQSLLNATQGTDTAGNAVWTANGINIKYQDGDLRVMRSPGVFLRTNSVNGTASATTAALHSTASQTDNPHFFVRFGDSKMHYNGCTFRIRTHSQAAGFDENNHITIF